jgi:hypothetical protein
LSALGPPDPHSVPPFRPSPPSTAPSARNGVSCDTA